MKIVADQEAVCGGEECHVIRRNIPFDIEHALRQYQSDEPRENSKASAIGIFMSRTSGVGSIRAKNRICVR
jgi:hypothetical protein